jgi:acyl carrier protein
MLNKAEMASRVRRVIASRLRIDPAKISDTANLNTDLAATSIDFVETVMSLEDEFGIVISDQDAEKVKTVGDLTALVGRMLH